MNNTQLITVLRTFDKKECREFVKWLSSPFFNQREDVLDLFQYLTSGKRLDDPKFLDKERVYRKIFPRQPYDDARMRQTTHFLLKQIEQYLGYKELMCDPLENEIALARVYRRRKLAKLFQRQIKQLYKKREEVLLQDTRMLRHNFAITDEYTTFQNEQAKKGKVNFQENIDALDAYLIAEKLKQACYVSAHQKVYTLDYHIRLLEEVMDLVEREPDLLNQPSIAVYYYGYLLQIKEGEEQEAAFYQLKELVEHRLSAFPEFERRDIYLMALNYCVGRMNKGSQPFIREAFELYRHGLSAEIIIQGGVLSSITYLNITSIGLHLKEFDFIDSCIADYSEYLPIADRENFRQYGLAKLYFERRQYSEAMGLLVQFESKNVLVNLNAKSMLLKMFYELDEYDALESYLESFRVYLNRKEIGYHKPIFGNLVKFTRRLLRVNPFDKEQREKLAAEIKVANPLFERAWLLEQLERM